MYFQHDGNLPHYSRLVREYLNASFPNRWLGRLGSVAWTRDRQILHLLTITSGPAVTAVTVSNFSRIISVIVNFEI